MECQPTFSKLMPESNGEIIIPKDVPERAGQAGSQARRSGPPGNPDGVGGDAGDGNLDSRARRQGHGEPLIRLQPASGTVNRGRDSL